MATYYIDTASTGTGDGTTTATSGANAAWAAFSEITGEAAGDTISLNKGDEWREKLTVATSGSSGSPITFNAYGTGVDPIINASVVYSSWTGEGETVIIDKASQAANFRIFNVNGRQHVGQGDWVADDDYIISSIEIDISHIGGTGATAVVAEVYNVDGLNLGTLVSGTATSDAQDINAVTTYKFTGMAAEVSNGNDYSIIVRRTDRGVHADNWCHIYYDDGGDSWSGQMQQWDGSKVNAGKYAGTEMGIKVYQGGVSPYYASYTTEPSQVFWDDALLTENTTSKATLATSQWWNDTTNDRIYVYDNPSGHTVEASYYGYCVELNTKSYITIDGLHCEKGRVHNLHADTTAGSFDGLIIQNCTIEKGWNCGVNISGTFGATGHGVSTGVQILDNTFSENGVQGVLDGQTGFTVNVAGNGPNDYVAGVLVQGNTISSGAYGIKGDWFANDMIVARNYVEVTGTPYAVDGGRDITFQYNIADNANVDHSGYAFSIYRWEGAPGPPYGFAVDNVKILNNVMYGYKKGVSLADDNEDVIVKNNIFYSDFADNVPVWMEGGETRTRLDINNNCYYTGANACVFTISTVDTYTYAEWLVEGYDANALNTDPLMTDPANDDFTLQTTSPCINAGVDVSLTTDYSGEAVAPPPDIGAYETDISSMGGGLGMNMFMGEGLK